MKIKILLAFVIGISSTSFIGRIAVHVKAQAAVGPIHVCAAQDGVLHVVPYTAGCPPGQRRLLLKRANSAANTEKPKDKTLPDTSLDKAKLEDLNRRLIKLEEMGCAAFGKRRVVAPFEVVDRSGKLIFTVVENKVGLFDGPGIPIAAMVAYPQGGLFSARGGDVRVIFGINDPREAGLSVSEQGQTKIDFGKGLRKGNYRLLFLSNSDQVVAGIGESPDNKAGLLLINDGSGKQRAIMEVIDSGRGRIGIMSGSSKPIAALTEGEKGGGVFYVCAAGGSCDPPMVSAGTVDSGVGVVRTGPQFYIQGPTGAPGSFLIGKKQ
jgi:mRNA-degrading endonuclease RelE of RelBE toxin-antitoxin system